MNEPTFDHRCPATQAEKDRASGVKRQVQYCRSWQTWELLGENACTECGHVPDREWRRLMGAKQGLDAETFEPSAPRRGRPKSAAVEAGPPSEASTESESQ